ncbi:MAG TPA: hypothetical protein VLE21_05930 [Candidatus Nitrosocosmicus sp.]|nr:hypothetical protein [Candidatus Nitrosocosmicus sp.]
MLGSSFVNGGWVTTGLTVIITSSGSLDNSSSLVLSIQKRSVCSLVSAAANINFLL